MFRKEYPQPQFEREEWLNLNGSWNFAFDFGKTGRDRKLFESPEFENKIEVPFCPESKLSGIEYKDFMNAIWYSQKIQIPTEWKDKRVLLHFGAADYNTEVWINGQSVGSHVGGYTPFTFDITDQILETDNVIVVCCEDEGRSGLQPRGKQSGLYYSNGCDYTRTTGIWQTVWLEPVSQVSIANVQYYPNPDNGALNFTAKLNNPNDAVGNFKIQLKASFKGTDMGAISYDISSGQVSGELLLNDKHLWMPGNPNLYDLEIKLLNDEDEIDKVKSYFGLRTVQIAEQKVLINHQSVFQRLVLDQGFYPDGIYTAPSDDDLKNDILLGQSLGFNGARLHEKVFDPRYLYWADHLGYLVWGEQGNWGLDITGPQGLINFLPEWEEAVERDFNSPALIGWCPFNETWDNDGHKQDNRVLATVYHTTKRLDPTRPVIDTSGNFHVVTDIFDVHDYDQNPTTFAARYDKMQKRNEFYVQFPERQQYHQQPYFVSEYGGIWWNPENPDGWGYGDRPKSKEEFITRYKGLTEALLNNPEISGFCYTQIYDVEQEVNGLCYYNRTPKFEPSIFHAINSQTAAIERTESTFINS